MERSASLNIERRASADAILTDAMRFYERCSGRLASKPSVEIVDARISTYGKGVLRVSADCIKNGVPHEAGHHFVEIDDDANSGALLGALARRILSGYTLMSEKGQLTEASACYFEAAFLGRSKNKQAAAGDIINLLSSDRFFTNAVVYAKSRRTTTPDSLPVFLEKTRSNFRILSYAHSWWERIGGHDCDPCTAELGRTFIIMDLIMNNFDLSNTARDAVCAPARFVLNLLERWNTIIDTDKEAWVGRGIAKAKKLAEISGADTDALREMRFGKLQSSITPYLLRKQ